MNNKTPQKKFRVHSAVLRSALKKLAPIAVNKSVVEAVSGNVLVGVIGNSAELIATDFTVKAKVKIPIFASVPVPGMYKNLQLEQQQLENEAASPDVVNDGRKKYKPEAPTDAEEEVLTAEIEADEYQTFPGTVEPDEDFADDLTEDEIYNELEDYEEQEDNEPPFGDEPATEQLPRPSYSQEYDYCFLLPLAPALAILDADVIVTIDASEQELISIKDSKENEYKIASFDPKDYPVGLFAIALPEPLFEVSAEELKAAALSVGQFVGTDSLRPALTGINLQPMHNRIKVAATDAHVLAVKAIETNTEFIGADNVTLPPIVFKLLPTTGNVMAFSLFNGEVMLQCNEITIQVTPVDGRYPDYSVIIPEKDSAKFTVIIGRSELLKVLKKAVHLVDKATQKVKLLISTNEGTVRLFAPVAIEQSYHAMDIMLSAKVEMSANIDERGLPIEPDPYFEIGFNAALMQKLIAQSVAEDSVIMELSLPNRAIVVNRANPDTVSLIMPVMDHH